MDRVDSSETDLDLDIDLESGGATSEEDVRKNHSLSCESSSNAYRDRGDCLCSSSKSLLVSDDASEKNKDMNSVGKMIDKEKRKKHKSEKPSSKPPRPPKGPSLNASDMKLLKEISEINSKRKKMERIRTLRRMKKEKGSSTSGNLIAFLVTMVFFLVIIFQGLLGSHV